MTAPEVIAIFDIGKTNKKILLFDKQYRLVYEETVSLPFITDEDGIPCEDIAALVRWMKDAMNRLLANREWSICAINFSTYGASLVHIDEAGQPVTPLYNYSKPISEATAASFYALFGTAAQFAVQTGAPRLAMLNSGLQLYWLKHDRAGDFLKIGCSLHLPQYLSYVFTGHRTADITSVGCHTGMWDARQHRYHNWLEKEGIQSLLPPVRPFAEVQQVEYEGHSLIVGIGLHDSSASVLPFLMQSPGPICILSTGTWNIALLPSFTGTLDEEDYRRDCLYYFLGIDRPIAAARIFLGHEIECQLKKITKHFNTSDLSFPDIQTDGAMLRQLCISNTREKTFIPEMMYGTGPRPLLRGEGAELGRFTSVKEAYHKLMLDAAYLQKESLVLLLNRSPFTRMYVTGGFARNAVFMDILQHFFPELDFYLASVNNGSALGAAMAIHDKWNERELNKEMVEMRLFTPSAQLDLSDYVYLGND
jgi:L-fuculokinase